MCRPARTRRHANGRRRLRTKLVKGMRVERHAAERRKVPVVVAAPVVTPSARRAAVKKCVRGARRVHRAGVGVCVARVQRAQAVKRESARVACNHATCGSAGACGVG